MKNSRDPDTEPTRWALWRLDDNDNRFVVAVFARREEAEAAARAFEAHGHKQTSGWRLRTVPHRDAPGFKSRLCRSEASREPAQFEASAWCLVG